MISVPAANRQNPFFLYFAFGSNLLPERLHINCPSAKFEGIACLPYAKLGFCGHSERWNGGVATVQLEAQHLDVIVSPESSVPSTPASFAPTSSTEVPSQTVSSPSLSPTSDVTSVNGDSQLLCRASGTSQPLVADTLPSDILRSYLPGVPVRYDEKIPCVWGAIWSIQEADRPALDKQEGVDILEYAPFVAQTLVFTSKHSATQARNNMGFNMRDPFASEAYDITPLPALLYRKIQKKGSPLANVQLAPPSESYLLVIIRGAIRAQLPWLYLQLLASVPTNGNVSSYPILRLVSKPLPLASIEEDQ